MLLIGLTGSLATGKSTVSTLLRSAPYNLPIIDADILARQVVEPGGYGYNRVVRAFGPTTPDLLLGPATPPTDATDSQIDSTSSSSAADTTSRASLKRKPAEEEKDTRNEPPRPINRAALGRRVFGSSPDRVRDRKILNGIIHPLVRLAILRSILYYWLRGHWAVVLDIPLLYESGLDLLCGVVVMVAVREPEVQMQRLRERDKALSEQEARERVESQMGVMEKVGRTRARGRRRGKVVANDGGREELVREVRRVHAEMLGDGGGAKWKRVWLWGNPVIVGFVCLWQIWCSYRARKSWKGKRAEDDKRSE